MISQALDYHDNPGGARVRRKPKSERDTAAEKRKYFPPATTSVHGVVDFFFISPLREELERFWIAFILTQF